MFCKITARHAPSDGGAVPEKSKRAFGIGSGIAIAIGVAIATVLRINMNQKFGRQFCIISTTIPIAIPMPIPTWSQDFAGALRTEGILLTWRAGYAT